MRSVLSLTVAAAVAVHAVLGCCWHHAHVAEAADVESTEPAPQPKAHSCCHGHHAHEVAEPAHQLAEQDAAQIDSHQDDPSHHCPTPCSRKCEVASNGRVQVDESGTDFTLDVSLGLSSPVVEPIVVARKFALDDGIAEPPPVRLHLMHQLLLI